jgi:acetyl esterase
VVVSVDYRMAPEHYAPTAALDSVGAIRWLAEHAHSWGGDASGLGVPVTAAVEPSRRSCVRSSATRAGRRSAIRPCCIRPPMRPGAGPPSRSMRAPILTRAQIDVFLDLYLGPDGLAADDPLVSPRWADSHANLPPALVQSADLDPLRDEGRLYAERLAAAGVPARHTNYVGTPLRFASVPGATPIGRQHRSELVGELSSHLYP